MNIMHPQPADYQHRLRVPLEPMFQRPQSFRPPYQKDLWFALGVATGWLTHALLCA